MEDLAGKQFGPYTIISPFGEGGMATVYRAFQPSMNRYVALKVLPRFHSSDPEFLGRFEQEAMALAQLQHPFILPVYDYGESEGYTYFVMPLMQNGNLAELMADERFSLDRIQQIVSQIGSALEFAHMRGFIHRDVKPSNVLLDETGNCILMDFGIAKIIEGSKEFTRTGGIIGTPVYMSPEQGSGQKIDHKSDIYSLGIILYEMATGRPPFEAETPIAVIFKHVHDPLPPPNSLNPDLPEEVEKVILKSLAKDPEDRYESVRDMVDALSKAVTASISSESTRVEIPPTIREVMPKTEREIPNVLEGKLEHEERPEEAQSRKSRIREALKRKFPFKPLLFLVGAFSLVLIGVWLTNLGFFSQDELSASNNLATSTSDLSSTTGTSTPQQLNPTAILAPPTASPYPIPPISPTVTPFLDPLAEIPSVPTPEASGLGYENVTILGFNLKVHPFDDIRVRKAIAYAIDRDALIGFYRAFWDNRSYIPATSYVPRDIIGLDLYGNIGYSYNPDLARQLLAEAGYPNGDGFPELTLAHYPTTSNQTSAIRIAEMINENLGINVSVHWLEDASKIFTSDMGFLHYSWFFRVSADPYFGLYTSICGGYDFDYYGSDTSKSLDETLRSTGDWLSRRKLIIEHSNRACEEKWDPHFKWDSPEYRSLLEDALSETDYTSRLLLYVQAEVLLTETDVVVVPLGHFKNK